MLPKLSRNLFFLIVAIFSNFADSKMNTCRRVYDFSKTEFIEFYYLDELVYAEGSHFLGIILSGNRFSVKEFRNLEEARIFYSNTPVESRQVVTQVIQSRAKNSESSMARVRDLSLRYDGKLSFRIKSPASLKAKIFDRTLAFSKKGQPFTLEDLADIVGVRIVVPLDSPLLKTSDVDFWGKELGVDASKIKEIELKGTAHDRSNGRYYTAVHLNLELTGRIEIQIMTEPMSIWHKWDHAHVYKPIKKTKPEILERRRLYSRAWSRIVAELDLVSAPNSRSARLVQILSELGISSTTSTGELNQSLLEKFGLVEQDGIPRDSINRILDIYF